MYIFIENKPDLEITSSITEKELSLLVSLARRGLVLAEIMVKDCGKLRRLSVADVDVSRTLPAFIFSSESIVPPPCLSPGVSCDAPRFSLIRAFLELA